MSEDATMTDTRRETGACVVKLFMWTRRREMRLCFSKSRNVVYAHICAHMHSLLLTISGVEYLL